MSRQTPDRSEGLAHDQTFPERNRMQPMQFDGSHHVLRRRTMHAPPAQTPDMQDGLLGTRISFLVVAV
jgi:hypothetical protein